jgi:hypothetical protein
VEGVHEHPNDIRVSLVRRDLGEVAALVANRMIAFRADHAGITLDVELFSLPFRFSAVFISWADIDRIVLYRRLWGRFRGAECIGIERRRGAPVIAGGNEPASARYPA